MLAQGRRVTILDNLSVGRRGAPEAARFVHGDVRDPAAVADALTGVDCVFHLAAQVTIRGSFERFYEDLDTNVMGTARLLRALDPAAIKWFVLASSMAVYADAPSPAPIDEAHPTAPLAGGIGKLAAEGVANRFWPPGDSPRPCATSIRSDPVRRLMPYVGVITIFVNRLLGGEAPVVFGDGEQQRDFVHVEDIVAGTLAAPDRTPGIYNLALAGHIAQRAGVDADQEAESESRARACPRADGRAALFGRRYQCGENSTRLRAAVAPARPRFGDRGRDRACPAVATGPGACPPSLSSALARSVAGTPAQFKVSVARSSRSRQRTSGWIRSNPIVSTTCVTRRCISVRHAAAGSPFAER